MSQAEKIVIGEAPLRRQDVVAVARHGLSLELSASAWVRIDNAQAAAILKSDELLQTVFPNLL